VSLPLFAGLATGLHGPTADIVAFREQRPLPISNPRTIPVCRTGLGATRPYFLEGWTVPAGVSPMALSHERQSSAPQCWDLRC